jgi:hypothetical protein
MFQSPIEASELLMPDTTVQLVLKDGVLVVTDAVHGERVLGENVVRRSELLQTLRETRNGTSTLDVTAEGFWLWESVRHTTSLSITEMCSLLQVRS